MEKNKSPNIFIKFIKSFTDIRVYNSIKAESMGKSFLYLILLSLLTGIILSVVITSRINTSINKTINFMESDNMPDISVTDGTLNIDIEKPLIVTQDKDFIFIIDMSSEYTLNELAGYTLGYLVTPERIIISRAGSPPMPLEFKNFGDFDINKESVIELIHRFKGLVLGILCFLTIAGTILFNLFLSLLLSIVGTIINSIMHTDLSYGELYRIGIYSLTLPAIITLLLNVFTMGISLGYKSLIHVAISTLIIVLALKYMNDNDENKRINNMY